MPGPVPSPQRAQPKLRPTPKVRGRLESTPILVTADSSSETEGSPVILLPGPSEEPEIVTPARWPDEREAERLRQSLAGLMIDAVEDGRLEQALRQWDHDSEVVEDREVAAERMEAVDHPLVDSGGDVLPRPAPEDITESMGVVPYPLPLRTQGGPAEEKPLLSLLEPMPTLETKTDDGNMVKGQGADVSASSLSWRRRLRLLLEPSSGRWRDARRSPRSSAWPRRTCLWPLVR